MQAQCHIEVAGPQGNVAINLKPVSIVPTLSSCPLLGYNYRTKIEYKITITKKNPNFRLYVLQGNITCGGVNSFFNLPENEGEDEIFSAINWRGESDCETVTSQICTTITLSIQGTGIPYQTIPCEISLPVELINVNVQQVKDAVKVSWETASELNNDFFSVQRSQHGNKWETTATVKGAGNSSVPQIYESFDYTPYYEQLTYYRIKQTDFNGIVSYSPIKSIGIYDMVKNRVHIYPNPSSNRLTIEGDESEIAFLGLYNTQGQEVYFLLVSKTETKSIIDISSLPKGFYILKTKKISYTVQKK